MRRLLPVLTLLVTSCACSPGSHGDLETLPTWSYDPQLLFPADRSLARPEDGVALAAGRLLVADQVQGLRLVNPDGTSRPFGRFAEAGYVHEPPGRPGGSGGVSLEPDGEHVLVADAHTGAIYRVSVADETTTLIYRHAFGVNTAYRDKTGALWFTQSTENAGPESEARMYAALDLPVPDGALFRMAPAKPGEPMIDPVRMVAGLSFANGLVIDEETGHLYLAETMGNRVYAFHVGIATGELSDRRVIAEIQTPDNVELDEAGRVWVVSPVRNELVVVNPSTEEQKAVFRAASPGNDRIAAEWQRRFAAGEPLLALLEPDMWTPLPGPLTGVILTPGEGPVYLAGLGDALIRLNR